MLGGYPLVCFLTSLFLCVYGAKKPHIIFFLVDDMGWNDVGFHGMRQIPTPNIDALAANGVILNNYYTSPACSPSRSALMSGNMPTTTGLQHLVILDAQQKALPIEYKILPQYLNDQGYESHIVGKWHLGFHEKKYTPLERGFKSHYGFWTGASDLFFHSASRVYNTSKMINVPHYETRETMLLDGLNLQNNYHRISNLQGEYLTNVFTERSVRVIRKHNQEKPLFLFISHHGVHRSNFYLPVRAPEEYTRNFTHIQDSTRRNFAGALTAIDVSVGEVMEALEKKGMLQDSIFIFSSDNGAPRRHTETSNGGSNYPLRGAKLTAWEGGVRAVGLIWSPLLKRPRTVHEGLMHIVDWIPTLYKAAGGNPNALYDLDGLDMWQSINDHTPSPRKNIILQSDPVWNLMGYRSGDFKIISGNFPGPNLNKHTGDPGRDDPPVGSSLLDSKTAQVLRRHYGGEVNVKPKPVQVECGQRLVNNITKCDVKNEVCLFNLKHDPCEFHNLAKKYPEIVLRLQRELSSIPVRKPIEPPGDYDCNPVYHSGFWSPWITDTCDFAEL